SLRFVHFNRAGEELLGIPRSELIGKNDFDFFPPEQAKFFTEKDRAVLEKGHLVEIAEERIQTRTRGERILHTKKIPIMDGNSEARYLLGIAEDITERRELEEALRRQAAELKTANEELESFSYSVSHDLRAPLRAIDGFSQALLEDSAERLDAPARRDLERVR